MGSPAQTVVDLLTELVALRPVTAEVDRVNAAVHRLREFLDAAGVHTREYTLQDRRILYAATAETDEVDYLLNVHLDVVPAEDAMFTVTSRDGWLHGRGTADCLGNSCLVAALLASLRGRASVGAIFSTDEETGGTTTAYMAGQPIRARRLIAVLDGAGNAVTIAQKGVLTLQLCASGQACHSAEPWEGVNALDRLIDGYAAIRDLFPQATADDPWHPTLTATRCSAGTVSNRVPDSAEMTVNIRYVDPGARNTIIETIQQKSGLEVEVLMQCPPVSVDPETPVIAELRSHLEQHLGVAVPFERLNGATDARHFAGHNAPVVILGLPGTGPHSSHEALEIAGIEPLFNALADFLNRRSPRR
mgnify:CR=1 FL=1